MNHDSLLHPRLRQVNLLLQISPDHQSIPKLAPIWLARRQRQWIHMVVHHMHLLVNSGILFKVACPVTFYLFDQCINRLHLSLLHWINLVVLAQLLIIPFLSMITDLLCIFGHFLKLKLLKFKLLYVSLYAFNLSQGLILIESLILSGHGQLYFLNDFFFRKSLCL